MKRHNAMSVGEIIDQAINSTGHRDEFDRQRACFVWQEIVGPSFNRATTRRWVEGDVMHVSLTSATMKNELSFRKEALVEAINAAVGAKIISQLVIH